MTEAGHEGSLTKLQPTEINGVLWPTPQVHRPTKRTYQCGFSDVEKINANELKHTYIFELSAMYTLPPVIQLSLGESICIT